METDSEIEDQLGVEEMLDGLLEETRYQQEKKHGSAPTYPIPPRVIGAVELPAIVKNIDRAEKALGRTSLDWEQLLDPTLDSIPYYLHVDNPFRRPIMSHNASTHNVVLKVTVPRRTGRKRKKGTDGPWQGDVDNAQGSDPSRSDKLCSIGRMDDPRVLRRKLQDNVDTYNVRAVGLIEHTHRFRGAADFHWNMEQSPFMQRFSEQALSGNAAQMAKFSLVPGVDQGPNADIIPPPVFTNIALPFPYNYTQNPYVRTEYDSENDVVRVRNYQDPIFRGHFVSADVYPLPTEPMVQPDLSDPEFLHALTLVRAAFAERPIWTRRALFNHCGRHVDNWYTLRRALFMVGYTFKGGPWRGAVTRYGVDPRLDPKYRPYQTLLFKLRKGKVGNMGEPFRATDHEDSKLRSYVQQGVQSHIFNGKDVYVDGRIWQVCDVIDPLILKIVENAPIRETCNISSGWFHMGSWAKIKGLMKHRILALQFGRQFTDADYAMAMEASSKTPPRESGSFVVPLPDLRLTDVEFRTLHGRKPVTSNKKKKKSHRFHFRMESKAVDVGDKAASPGGATVPRSVSPVVDPDLQIEQDLLSLAGRSGDDNQDGEDEGNNNGVDDERESAGEGFVRDEMGRYGYELSDDDDEDEEDTVYEEFETEEEEEIDDDLENEEGSAVGDESQGESEPGGSGEEEQESNDDSGG